MKREINCPECLPNTSKYRGLCFVPVSGTIVDPYPGEKMKVVKGKAKFAMFCDSCAKKIEENQECFAISIWSEYSSIPYRPWESTYIREKENGSKTEPGGDEASS